MYRILVVDDDATCLFLANACLKRWNYYEARAVSHPLQALSILGEDEKPYDLVLADVHMPVMDGFELLGHVTTKFNIPVVLISADDKAEMMCKGLRSGAPAYLLKPVTVDIVRNIWQYSVSWRNKERNTYRRITDQATVPRSICSSSSSNRDDTEDKPKKKETKETAIWTPNLHNRFVEVILILGPQNAVPKNILELMDVQSLTRVQVGSHLQKFRKFLESILDGKTSLNESTNSWIDGNYHSSIVGGNPNQILVDQLLEERRTGKSAAPIPASLPLPPYNESEASSSRRRNIATLRPINYASSSVNAATRTEGLGGGIYQHAVNVATPTLGQHNVTFQNDVNVVMPAVGHVGVTNFQSDGSLNLGNVVGSRCITYENQILNLNYDEANEMGNVQLHHDPVIDSSLGAHQFRNTFGLHEQFGNVQDDPNNSNSFDADQFGNHQMGSVQLDPPNNFVNLFGGANEFGNALAMPQLGGGAQMSDGGWFVNNSSAVNNTPAAAADYSLLGFDPNLNQGEDWDDLLNLDFLEDKDPQQLTSAHEKND